MESDLYNYSFVIFNVNFKIFLKTLSVLNNSTDESAKYLKSSKLKEKHLNR